MATAAEKLANNLNFGALGKATELRNRLLFTLGALIIFIACVFGCVYLSKKKVIIYSSINTINFHRACNSFHIDKIFFNK